MHAAASHSRATARQSRRAAAIAAAGTFHVAVTHPAVTEPIVAAAAVASLTRPWPPLLDDCTGRISDTDRSRNEEVIRASRHGPAPSRRTPAWRPMRPQDPRRRVRSDPHRLLPEEAPRRHGPGRALPSTSATRSYAVWRPSERPGRQTSDRKDSQIERRDANIEALTAFKKLGLCRLAAERYETMRLRSAQSSPEPPHPLSRQPSLAPGPLSSAPAVDSTPVRLAVMPRPVTRPPRAVRPGREPTPSASSRPTSPSSTLVPAQQRKRPGVPRIRGNS